MAPPFLRFLSATDYLAQRFQCIAITTHPRQDGPQADRDAASVGVIVSGMVSQGGYHFDFIDWLIDPKHEIAVLVAVNARAFVVLPPAKGIVQKHVCFAVPRCVVDVSNGFAHQFGHTYSDARFIRDVQALLAGNETPGTGSRSNLTPREIRPGFFHETAARRLRYFQLK